MLNLCGRKTGAVAQWSVYCAVDLVKAGIVGLTSGKDSLSDHFSVNNFFKSTRVQTF